MRFNSSHEATDRVLLTRGQVAQRLGVTDRTVDRWYKMGIIPESARVVLGKQCVRYRATVLDECFMKAPADGSPLIEGGEK